MFQLHGKSMEATCLLLPLLHSPYLLPLARPVSFLLVLFANFALLIAINLKLYINFNITRCGAESSSRQSTRDGVLIWFIALFLNLITNLISPFHLGPVEEGHRLGGGKHFFEVEKEWRRFFSLFLFLFLWLNQVKRKMEKNKNLGKL